MTDTNKNIITNLFSLPCVLFSVYEYFNDKDWRFMLGFFVVGLSLFLFKASRTRSFLEKLFEKLIK